MEAEDVDIKDSKILIVYGKQLSADDGGYNIDLNLITDAAIAKFSGTSDHNG